MYDHRSRCRPYRSIARRRRRQSSRIHLNEIHFSLSRAKSVRPVRPVRPASPFSPRARLVLASHLARVSPSLARSNTTSLDARIPSALVARDECARAFERMRARRECNAMTRANALERGRRRRDATCVEIRIRIRRRVLRARDRSIARREIRRRVPSVDVPTGGATAATTSTTRGGWEGPPGAWGGEGTRSS